MNRIALRQGQAFLIQGKRYRFAERARDAMRMPIFKEIGTEIPRPIHDEDLLKLMEGGHVRPLSEAEAAAEGPVPEPVLFCIDEIKTKWSREATKRQLHYCRVWEAHGRPSGTDAELEAVIAQSAAELGDGCPPSTRTMRRFIAKWIRNGCLPSGCVPDVANRGRSTTIEDQVAEIARDVIWTVYLTTDQPTLKSCYSTVCVRIEDYNVNVPPGAPKLEPPHLSYMYRLLNAEVDQYTQTLLRKGKAEADRKYFPRGSGVITTRHNERWEMDTTPIDLVLVAPDTGEPIGRAYLTVIIDVHTRMIVGYYLGFEPESILSAVETLRHAMWFKPDLSKIYPDIKNQMLPFGRCEVLVVDNASQYGRAFKRVCERAGIDLQQTPVLKPWFKGAVERVIRTMMHGLFHRVPGSTFANIFQRSKEKPPETVAVATLEDARKMFHQWVVDQYPFASHRGLGFDRRPIDAWRESCELHETVMPPDPETLNATLGIPFFAKGWPYGVQYENLFYNSDFIANICIGHKKAPLIDCTLNPADIRKIRVKNPDTGEWGEAVLYKPHLALGDGGPISLRQYLVALELRKREPDKYGDDGGLHRAIDFTRRYIAENLTKGSSKERRERARHKFDGAFAQPIQHARHDPEASARPISAEIFDQPPGPAKPVVVVPADVPAEASADVPVAVPADAPVDAAPKRRSKKAKADPTPPSEPPAYVPVLDEDTDDMDALVQQLGMETRER